MKDMLKFIDKKKMLIVFAFCTIYNLAVYGSSFCLSYFATSPLTIEKLTQLLISLIILFVISMLFNWLFIHTAQMFLFKIEYDAKNYFYKKLQKMNPKNISKYHSGYIQSLIERSAQDYAIIIESILYEFLPLSIGIISFIYMACKQSLIIGLVSVIIFLLAFVVRYKMLKHKKKYSKKMNETRAAYNGTLIDFIQNIFTVIKLNAEDFTNKVLKKKTILFLKDLQANEDMTANINVTFNFFTNLLYIIIIVASIFVIKNGGDALPYLLFYLSIIGKVTDKLASSSKEVEHIFRFQVSKKQLDEIIGTSAEHITTNEWNALKVEDGVFSYENNSCDIRIPKFSLKKGDKISVMGESGQGKTTILNILSGIYELKSGNILIDDHKIENEKIDTVFISQNVELFDLSIRENLTLGKEISDEKLVDMFGDAGLTEWYNSLENGLDELVGEKGVKLSAGQRQRLNIIRGILINKDVYFFDEPTSNLDVESENKIIKMIEKYLSDKTYIIVTHRDGLKELCNKHYVFENHEMKEI